jgi:putative glutamine amidotransferase
MPIIGIAPCSKLPDYEESIRRSGGDVRLLERSTDAPKEALSGIDGLLLTGGGDVRPAIYGAVAHPLFDAAEPGRDEFEIELVRRALDADLPVLAICRGIQLLNVARGGTLIQDIPDELGTTINHRVATPPHAIAHDIWIESSSLLERLMGERFERGEACPVNSRHHQAAKTLGEGLITSATAPDGVIEAIEDPTRRFCLGVQWHPENFYRTGEFRSLFEAFVQACTR